MGSYSKNNLLKYDNNITVILDIYHFIKVLDIDYTGFYFLFEYITLFGLSL